MAPLTRNQHQLWKHDIKVARNYNSTVNANENRKMSQQLADDTLKSKSDEERLQNMYSLSYQNTWSPMNSPLPEFDPIGVSASIRVPSKFDEPKHPAGSYKSKRRNTLPHSSSPLSSSHISSLKEINRFPLEKIPEIVISPSTSNQLQEQDSSNGRDQAGPSTSKRSHKFIVTPTDTNVLEKYE